MSTLRGFLWRALTTAKLRRSRSGETRQRRWFGLSRGRLAFWACTCLMTVGVGVYVRAEIYRRISRFSGSSSANNVQSGGTLLIVGGGQMPEMIRQRFVELAGGSHARIVVIPASAVDQTTMDQYRETWLSYDVEAVDILHADSRTQADDPEFSKVLETATGVWLGGGQQTWLAAWYGRTKVESRLKDLLARNGVIGGTSAGSAIMSEVMIASGREKPFMGHGFDLIPGAIIDQHFVKRNRMRRLQSALEQHPDLIGFGIDEGTALQYAVESGRFRVIGQSCVVVCIPTKGTDERTSFRMDFLNPGDDFDVERLRKGDPLPLNYVDLDLILMGE